MGLQTSATAGVARGQAQEVGQFSGLAGDAAESIGEQSAQTQTTNATSDTSQMGGQAAQLLMQAPQMAAQLPQQASQVPQQLAQTATQPMQELSSLFQGMGANNLTGQGISPADLVSHFGSPDRIRRLRDQPSWLVRRRPRGRRATQCYQRRRVDTTACARGVETLH